MGFSSWIGEACPKRLALVTTGMYLFEVFYFPGQALFRLHTPPRAFSLHMRKVSRSFATASTWTSNSVLSFTWPMLRTISENQGAFAWHAV